MQLQGQLQQLQQMAQARMDELQQALAEAESKANSREAEILKARIDQERLSLDWFKAETDRLAVLQKDGHANDAQEIALAKLIQADDHKAADQMAQIQAAQAAQQTSGDSAAQ